MGKTIIRLDWIAQWVSYKKRNFLYIHEHLDSPLFFFMSSVLLIFLVFYVVCGFLSPFYVLCPMLPVSLDYPFLIASSVFSNVYLFCLSPFYVLCPMLPVSLDYPILIASSVFSNVYSFCLSPFYVLCPMLPVSLNYLFLIASSVFSNIYLYTYTFTSILKWTV